jgi:hypothetical protein
VIARLCEPASELNIAEDWYRRTALDDLLGVPAERVNYERLYRALDRLLPHNVVPTLGAKHLKSLARNPNCGSWASDPGARFELPLSAQRQLVFEKQTEPFGIGRGQSEPRTALR